MSNKLKKVKVIEKDFRKAICILEDLAFYENFDINNQNHIKTIKLFKARKENIDFDIELANRICGDNNNYPYRSSYYLTKFFQDLGYDYEHDGSTRRFWVEDVLKELSVYSLVNIIEKGIFRKRNFEKNEKNLTKDDFLKIAVNDFKKFIDDSIRANETISLIDVLDLNINVELLFQNIAETADIELNKLIEEAKSRFLISGDKQIAIEKLWDAFERFKTYYTNEKGKSESAQKLVDSISIGFNKDIIEEEFKILTKIGNDYRIRHHETDKIIIDTDQHLNYLFFRMLSLIDLCVSSLKINASKYESIL